MKVAITGGTGFIGRRVVAAHVALGDEVRILSRNPANNLSLPQNVAVVTGDLTSDKSLEAFVENADVLYHCAGELRDITRMEDLHINGTNRLARAAAGRIGRWVQLSSVGVFGPHVAGAVNEDTAIAPVGPYETSKAAADKVVALAAADGAFEMALLRPANVFAGDMTNNSLFGLLAMLERGLFFYIGQPGAIVNYVHADNVAAALRLCATVPAAAGRSYVISDPQPIETFIGALAFEIGRPAPRLRLPAGPVRYLATVGEMLLPSWPLSRTRVAALTGRAAYLNTRIATELGYHPIRTREECVSDLVAGWRAHQQQT